MKKYRLNYSIILIITFGLSMSYESKLTSYIFLCVLILPIVSLVLLLISYFSASLQMKESSGIINKNEQFSVSVKVRNKFILPLSPICLRGFFPSKKLSDIEEQRVLINVPPLKEIEINFKGAIKYRGEHIVGIKEIRFYDIFKIFCFSKKIDYYKSVVVIPRRLALIPIFGNVESDSEESTADIFSLEKHAFSSIREYRENDTIRNIHWKLSAKQEQLMVKQYECSVNSNILVFADFNGYMPLDDDNVETTDCIIESLLAINNCLVIEKYQCVNVWYDMAKNMPVTMTIDGAEDFEKLFSVMSVLPLQNEIMLFENIIDSYKSHLDEPKSIFFITSQVRQEFVSKLLQMDIFKCKDINILLINSSIQEQAVIDMLYKETKIRLWELDKDNLAESINSAIQVYMR